uniref:Uncharacterized protein n=1 Tax=Lotharella globosa TaxID=91324 RepID=A0A6U3AFT3_9EUKA
MGGGTLNPNIAIINQRHKNKHMIEQSVIRCLSNMGLKGSPMVVAVGLPLSEVRPLMSKMIAGMSESDIVPKGTFKANDPRRLLVRHMNRISKQDKQQIPPVVFVFSIPDGRVDSVHFPL